MRHLREGRITLIILGNLACLFLGISIAFCMDIERLQKIAGNLEDVAGRDINIIIEDSERPDAYLHPLGSIILTRGLVDAIEDDAEMAFIIGHEMGHVVMDHYNGNSTLGIAGDALLPDMGKEIEADGYSLMIIEAAGYGPAASLRVLGKIKTLGMVGQVSSIKRRIDALSF